MTDISNIPEDQRQRIIKEVSEKLIWDQIENGNETLCEALINEMSDLMLEWNRQGKTFDEMLLCLKDRFPRENGDHIGLALNKAIIKGFNVNGRSPQ